MTTSTVAADITANPGAVAAIIAAANRDGVDVRTALADAIQESGLNPTEVGDNGTSFGVYQLHEGGELGTLTEAQADNPATNAGVALGEFAAVQKANPSDTPGQLAYQSQRPAASLQPSYEAAVNANVSALTALGFTASAAPASLNLPAATDAGLVGGAAGAIADEIDPAAALVPSTSVLSPSSWLKIGVEVVGVTAGAALIVAAAWKTATPDKSIRSSGGPAASAAPAVAAAAETV